MKNTKIEWCDCDIDPLECLKSNIAKLADRQERGVINGNGDER